MRYCAFGLIVVYHITGLPVKLITDFFYGIYLMLVDGEYNLLLGLFTTCLCLLLISSYKISSTELGDRTHEIQYLHQR